MSLCLLNYEYPPIGAGAASATQAIANALTATGHRVTVVTAAIGELCGEKMESGVCTVRLQCRRRRTDRASLLEMLSFGAQARKQLPDIARRFGVDGIICFFTLPSGPAALSTWKKSGIPYVISLRGGDVPGLVPSIGWIHRILQPLRRAILRNAACVVANSEGLQQLSQAHDPTPVVVIPNGVDTERFRPPVVRRNDGVFRILAVGRLQKQKNHVFGLHVLARFRDAWNQHVEYHIAGDGPLRAGLQNLTEQLGLVEHVIWHGWTAREKLLEIYQSCDCLLHPTLYEGMPNAVLEAMAVGLPVVASDVSGNSHVVQDGETGFLCPLGDENAFSRALHALAADKALRERFGHSARRIVEQNHSWTRVAAGYVELLTQNARFR